MKNGSENASESIIQARDSHKINLREIPTYSGLRLFLIAYESESTQEFIMQDPTVASKVCGHEDVNIGGGLHMRYSEAPNAKYLASAIQGCLATKCRLQSPAGSRPEFRTTP